MGILRKRGILSYQQLKEAVDEGIVFSDSTPIDEDQIQPASIDLRLGDKAYRLISSFLPEKGQEIEKKLHEPNDYGSDMVMYEHPLTGDGMVLEKNSVYLIPLKERLNLPKGMGAKANPKSTTGRLDIFTRVITDCNPRFDEIQPGYKGRLYLEIIPRSFTVKVCEGLRLVQLRLRCGNTYVSDSELKRYHRKSPILFEGDDSVAASDIKISNGLFMSVDLIGSGRGDVIGFKSKKNSQSIDLRKNNYYNVEDFWEPIYSNSSGTLILEPEDFYILSSRERIRIPSEYAADMAPYEAGSGELRTHYAGFFDPGFGYGEKGELRGTKAVLEVRAHDVPFMIAHGQTFCKVFFERMMEVPERLYGPSIGSSYQHQGVTLSKQFRPYRIQPSHI